MKKSVEDVMPIATGLEREELEAELEVNLVRSFFSFSSFWIKCWFLDLVTLMRCFFLLNFFIFQGKKRFETDPPVGPFGTKVSLVYCDGQSFGYEKTVPNAHFLSRN